MRRHTYDFASKVLLDFLEGVLVLRVQHPRLRVVRQGADQLRDFGRLLDSVRFQSLQGDRKLQAVTYVAVCGFRVSHKPISGLLRHKRRPDMGDGNQ